MKPLFEYSDSLNSPYEAFYFQANDNSYLPVPPHWHYFVEVLYMIKGKVVVEYGSTQCTMEQGDLLFLHPETPHSISSCGTFPILYGVLKFNVNYLNLQHSHLPKLSELLQMIEENKELPSFFPKKEIAHIPMDNLFQTCIDIVSNKQFGYDILAHSYYCILVAELIKVWISKGFQIKKHVTKQKPSDALIPIVDYIHSHLQEELRVEELAHMANMSYSYFAKLFKQYYGQTCKDYILMLRLQKSEDLLLFTDYDLSYISQECGFCDCSHFMKYFRQKHHMTPKQYRKRYER